MPERDNAEKRTFSPEEFGSRLKVLCPDPEAVNEVLSSGSSCSIALTIDNQIIISTKTHRELIASGDYAAHECMYEANFSYKNGLSGGYWAKANLNQLLSPNSLSKYETQIYHKLKELYS